MPSRARFSVSSFMGMISNDDPSVIPEQYLAYARNVDFSNAGKISPMVMRDYPVDYSESQGAAWLNIGVDGEVWVKKNNVVYREGVAVAGISENSNRAFFYTDGTDVIIADGEGLYVYRDGEWINTVAMFSKQPTGEVGIHRSSINDTYISLAAGVSHFKQATGTPYLVIVITSAAIAAGIGDGSYVRLGDLDASWSDYDGTDTSLVLESTGTYLEYYLKDLDGNRLYDNSVSDGTGGTIIGPLNPMLSGLDNAPIEYLTGTWRHYVSLSVETAVGVLETQPEELSYARYSYMPGAVIIKTDLSGPTLSFRYDNVVSVSVDIDLTLDDVQSITGSSDPSKFKLNIYRTSMDESDLYLLESIELASIPSSGTIDAIVDDTSDEGLGDAYLESDELIATPAVTRATFAQRRMFACGDAENPNVLYMSRINSYGLFDASQNIVAPGRIVNVATSGDKVIVIGESTIWVYLLVDEYGKFSDTDSPVGTTSPDSVINTDAGIVFARGDGAWLFNGTTSVPISREVDPEWAGMTGEIQASASHDTIVFRANSKVMCAKMRYGLVSMFREFGHNKRPAWSVLTPPQHPDYLLMDPQAGTVYAQYNGELIDFFGGSEKSEMTIRTKDFGGGKVWRGWQLSVDMDPDDTVSITVATNRGIEKVYSIEPDGRRTYRVLLPKYLAGEYFNVSIVGLFDLHSVDLETQ